ncbi:MAG: hypothetical protein GY810_22145 [Aureispira sp.]|nr:hypothetical protein [Aureispira sp.]
MEENYSKEFFITKDSNIVHQAISEETNKWWTSKIDEKEDVLHLKFGDTYKVIKRKELIAPTIVLEWEVLDAFIAHDAISKKGEWKGTKIKWEIKKAEKGCIVSFSHQGLIPDFECYEMCVKGWGFYLDSLIQYLETGVGNPF